MQKAFGHNVRMATAAVAFGRWIRVCRTNVAMEAVPRQHSRISLRLNSGDLPNVHVFAHHGPKPFGQRDWCGTWRFSPRRSCRPPSGVHCNAGRARAGTAPWLDAFPSSESDPVDYRFTTPPIVQECRVFSANTAIAQDSLQKWSKGVKIIENIGEKRGFLAGFSSCIIIRVS